MFQLTRRAHPRVPYHTSVKFAAFNAKQLRLGQTNDFSAQGLCLKTDEPLAPYDRIRILMDSYSPGCSGPEGFRSYLAKILWTKQPSKANHMNYASGAKVLTRSHEPLGEIDESRWQVCGLCGTLIHVYQMQRTFQDARLCKDCFGYFQNLPSEKIRCCIERFLLGNVV